MGLSYYSCNRLLSLKDRNNNNPEIYIAEGNRTAGKSVSFKHHLFNTFLKRKKENEFIVLYRNKVDCQDIATSFFCDMKEIYYPNMELTQKKLFDGRCIELYLDGRRCGFAVPLVTSRRLKEHSSLFSNVGRMFFDEFQSPDNRYLSNEVDLLRNFHTTVARGKGKQTRKVDVYLVSNTITILNPYYKALGVLDLLKPDTKTLRGEGWVYEKIFNESAAKSMTESAFNQAFKDDTMLRHERDNVYLNDDYNLVYDKPKGGRYIFTIKYNNDFYHVEETGDFLYVCEGYDVTFPIRLCYKAHDMTSSEYNLVGVNSVYSTMMRNAFSQGKLIFDKYSTKMMAFDILSY